MAEPAPTPRARSRSLKRPRAERPVATVPAISPRSVLRNNLESTRINTEIERAETLAQINALNLHLADLDATLAACVAGSRELDNEEPRS